MSASDSDTGFSKEFRGVALWGDLNSAHQTLLLGGAVEDNIFDLSSLTKPILMSSLLMMTCERSQYSWENFLQIRISDWAKDLENTVLGNMSLRHLWEHRSGLPGHIDFLCGATAGKEPQRTALPSEWTRSKAWRAIIDQMTEQLESTPLEKASSTYSDLGYLLLGYALEVFHSSNLEELWNEWKLSHGLRPSQLEFFGIQKSKDSYQKLVPTESRHAFGEVNDNNAFFLGGVAPHAGLMGAVKDVYDWFVAIRNWSKEAPKILPWLKIQDGWNWRFYCGWDRPGDPMTTHAGARAPSDCLGHLGYTGTAFWWSESSNKIGILLSNRVCPSATPQNAEMMKNLRRQFFSALWQGTLSKEWQPILTNQSGPT